MFADTRVVGDGPLVVEESRHGTQVFVVSLGRELDSAVVDTARTCIETALAGPCKLVVVDLTELEFIDSAAIALFYGLAKMRRDPETLRLLGSRFAAVNRILALTGVSSVLPITATEHRPAAA